MRASRLPPTGLLLLVPLVLCLAWGCAPAAPEGNLLAGRQPALRAGVTDPGRLTDGVVSAEGGPWDGNASARFADLQAFAAWDLGTATRIGHLWLQGDNNDRYEVAVSDDGIEWRQVWTAGAVPDGGMRSRFEAIEPVEARWLRVRPLQGDRAFSLGEVAAFSGRPAVWPPRFPVDVATRAGQQLVSIFGILGLAFVFTAGRGRWPLLLAAGALAVVAVWVLAPGPLRPPHLAWFKAVVAALAGATLLRSVLGPQQQRLSPRQGTAILGGLAVLAVAAYYQFGALHFRHEAEGRKTFVHTWDMRHYQPLAKYFPELRFDGLYFASLAAYLDDLPQTTDAELAGVRIRDLRDNQVVTADLRRDAIAEAKARFSPERWEAFRADLRFFRETMGRKGYLGTMTDHGGNATPVWILTAWLVFGWLPASEWLLTLSGLLDPLLLGGMFYAVARTFGLRAMLVCVIAFGTTDFARFGATLVGSSLRYDWLAALGLGLCALRTGRWALAGGLVAYAGLIRAFPALALVFLAVPFAWEVAQVARTRGRLPKAAELPSLRPFLRTAAGATATVVVLVGLSVAVFGWEAGWGAWFEKILPHAGKPNVNHVGLRTVIAYEAENVASRVIDWKNPSRGTAGR